MKQKYDPPLHNVPLMFRLQNLRKSWVCQNCRRAKLEELKCENKILEVEHDIFNMHLDEINEEQDRMKNKLEELVAEKQKVFKTNFKENKQGADSEGS